MRWAGDMTGAEMMAQFKSPYSPSLIYRNTNWVWHAGKPVYLLREPEGAAVWVLQEFTQEVDPTLEADNLDQLGAKYKNLPEGFTFETKILDEELSLDTSPRAAGPRSCATSSGALIRAAATAPTPAPTTCPDPRSGRRR